MKDFIEPIATVTKTSGLDGDVKLKPLSRYFDHYIFKNKLYLGNTALDLNDCILENIKGIGKGRIFKIKNHNTLYDAKKIIGMNIYVKPDKKDKINYISKNLLGFDVVSDDGLKIGTLKDVMWLQNNDVYIIQNNEKEILIPVIPEFVEKVDYLENNIVVKPIEGLLDH